jgi:hypothetical protein
MYELTAMRPPFDAFNIRGLVEKITKYVAPPLPAEYSDNWKNIVKRWAGWRAGWMDGTMVG